MADIAWLFWYVWLLLTFAGWASSRLPGRDSMVRLILLCPGVLTAIILLFWTAISGSFPWIWICYILAGTFFIFSAKKVLLRRIRNHRKRILKAESSEIEKRREGPSNHRAHPANSTGHTAGPKTEQFWKDEERIRQIEKKLEIFGIEEAAEAEAEAEEARRRTTQNS